MRLLLLLFVATLAGCAGDDADAPDDETTPTTSATSTSTSTSTSASTSTSNGQTVTHVINIQNFAYSDEDITILVGERVNWINRDSTAHTVTSDGDGPMDSGSMGQDAGYAVTFDEPGVYPYHCDFHGSMTATIRVEAV